MKRWSEVMKWLVLSQLLIWAQSCSSQSEKDGQLPSQREVNKSMESINRQFMRDESAQIEGYIARRGWEMTTTGTGLRYMIYEKGTGPQAAMGMRAVIDYEVSLLDGTVVYTSGESGPTEFLIGQDNVESGLHEGITYMRVGDRAKFILPSHLAHGLTGDQNKIPPRSSVVYDITLREVK